MRRRRGYRRRRRGGKPVIVLGILAGVLLLAAVLFLAVRVTKIDVTGNRQYTEEQIINLIFDGKWSRNSAYCYYESQFREHKSIPFIEEYKVEFKSPTHVEVVVFEKSVVGYVPSMSSYMYFDKDGIIVESSGEQLPGVPWVTGLEYGKILLYEPLEVKNDPDGEIFGRILNLTQVLSINEVKVDKIDFDSFGNANLSVGDITVELGGSENLDGKVTELKGILPELSGLSGTLYLDTYDEANTNPTYTFKKN